MVHMKARSLALLLVVIAPFTAAQAVPPDAAGLTPTNAPAPPVLSELDLPLERLAAWGRREFRYELRQGTQVQLLGTVTLSTVLERGELVLEDRVDIVLDGAAHWQEVQSTGPLARELRPSGLRVRGTAEDGGAAPELLADLDATSLRARVGEATRSEALPPGTVTDAALWRLLTLLPRRPGFAVRVEHLLLAARLQPLPGATIHCTGVEDVALERGAVAAHRFDATREGQVFLSAWVDDDGRLVQACLDGRRWWVARG